MSDQQKKPIGILIENCEDVTLSNNKGIGDMDFIVAKNSKRIKGKDNKHYTSNQEFISTSKQWHEKPLGIVLIGLIVTVFGGGLLYFLNWV